MNMTSLGTHLNNTRNSVVPFKAGRQNKNFSSLENSNRDINIGSNEQSKFSPNQTGGFNTPVNPFDLGIHTLAWSKDKIKHTQKPIIKRN